MGTRLAVPALSHRCDVGLVLALAPASGYPGIVVRRLSGMVIPLLLVAALPAGVQASTAAVRKVLGAIYARFDRAAEAKDSGPLQRLIREETTPDGIVQRPGYSDTREEWIRRVKASQAHWQPARQAHTTIDRLTVHGVEATALVSGRMTIVSTLPVFTHDSTRRPHTFVTIYTNRDVWRKTPAGWKRQRAQNVRFRRFMDGRLVALRPRPSGANASPHGADRHPPSKIPSVRDQGNR